MRSLHSTPLRSTPFTPCATLRHHPIYRPQDRLRYLHSIVYPPYWELKKDLAVRYQSLRILVSAAELFQSLELWDDVVDCYTQMGKRKEARGVLEERLKKVAPTPRMYTAMGDLTELPECEAHYEKAWELSKGRYARAKVQLGRRAFNDNRLEDAEGHLAAALEVQPVACNEWFLLGTCRMRLSKWQAALTAFSRAISQQGR
jgi:tetratricopeptide (TPR) repeat protein